MFKSLNIYLVLIFIIAGCAVKQVIRFDELPKEPIQQIPNELRGARVTASYWADFNSDTILTRITRIMGNLGESNFNTVFFQVREEADALYPSPIDTWSKRFNYKDPGFDPVKKAVKEAHNHGLKFYADFNILSFWNEKNPPKDSKHLYFKHGPEVAPEQSWLCFSEDGIPMKNYMNPALPQVKTYLKKIIRHFVETYDIDGLFFDHLYYPRSRYTNDPLSLKKYEADSLQSPLSIDIWARNQLTDLVEDIVVEAMLIKPYLVNSVAIRDLCSKETIPGHEQFYSEYRDYYQHAIDWLDKGIMDFIVPMIHCDLLNPVLNFTDVMLDFKKKTEHDKYIYPGIKMSSDWIENGETASQVNFVRANGGVGTVMCPIREPKTQSLKIVRDIIYPEKVKPPENMKRVKPEQVVALDVGDLLSVNRAGQQIRLLDARKNKMTDSEGRVGLIIPEKLKTLDLTTNKASLRFSMRRWYTPYNYIVLSDNSVTRAAPWVELRRMPRDETDNPEYHLLCKTEYPARAWINSDTAKVYKTGVFFKKIKLNQGPNRVHVEVLSEDSTSVLYGREFIYKKKDETRKPFPLWIDEKSVEPNEDIKLMSDDIVRISFNGSRGQVGSVQINPGKLKLPCSRTDFNDFSLYQTDLHLHLLENNEKHSIKLILESEIDKPNQEFYEHDLTAVLGINSLDNFPLVRTTSSNSILSHSLGKVRLGSPIRAEYGPGVTLKTNGKIGEYYRIKLSRTEEGYIHQDNIEELPQGVVQPSYYINSMYCSPDSVADILRIPYLEPIPYAVYPEPDQKRIIISLYGAKTSSTWITHRNNRKYIEKVTWRQATPETYQAIVNLRTSKIWGYDIRPKGSSLVFRLNYPPVMSGVDSNKVLLGLKIAIEAGHGGNNLGAVGLSGLEEKDINLDLAKKLADICVKNGADVLQIRDTDKYMTLTTKRDTARFSDAHMLISIHANAAGTRGGYLRVGGTSTYYNNPFWAKLAERIYDRLLELDIDEFGVIGSFNYKVIRVTQMPSILVEQAFMSHAEDEEKLACEQFRQDMAQKIYQGIIDFISYMDNNNE